MKLSEIRAQFPMYAKVPDEQLLIGLHRKFYPDVPFKDFNAAIEYDIKPDASEGMSGTQKFLAGVGKSVTDTARGLGQMVGVVDRADIAESRKLDADLMKHGAAKVGAFTGDVATTLPLAFVPGANTVKGAALIGAATGLARPSESTDETLQNTALGGALGGGSILAGRGLAGAYQAATGLVRPLTAKGQQQIAGEIFDASATDSAKALRNLRNAKQFVKGSAPTVGQAADDAGLAQLERTLLNNPESAGPLQKVYAAQMEARKKAIADVAGTPEYRKAIEEGRSIFAKEDYANAFAKGIDADMAKALKPQIESIMKRPSIQNAKMAAKKLAAEQDVELTNFGSVEGLDWVKKALDDQISAAAKGTSSIGDVKLRALIQTKNDLMDVLEQIAPAYKEANDNFAQMSKQINAADVAADLQKRLYKNAEFGSGKEMASTYQTELGKALESVKGVTGQNKALADVMPEADLDTLKGIAFDLARKENAQNLGRAVGSPTMQNMLGQNLLRRVAGPVGLPNSFADSVLATTMARPYDWAAKAAQPRVAGFLSEAMADPVKAQALLNMARQPSKLGKTAKELEKFLPAGGLLALENR